MITSYFRFIKKQSLIDKIVLILASIVLVIYLLLLINTKEECVSRQSLVDGRVTFGFLGFKRYCLIENGKWLPFNYVVDFPSKKVNRTDNQISPTPTSTPANLKPSQAPPRKSLTI